MACVVILPTFLLTGSIANANPLEGWSGEAQQMIRNLVATKAAEVLAGAPRPVAAFDCDNTLIDGDISNATLVMRVGPASVAKAYRQYEELWESGRNIEACGYLAGLMGGMTFAEASALGRDALAKAEAQPRCMRHLPTGQGQGQIEMEQGIRIRKPMVSLVAYLQAAGWEVYVVSASAQPVVEAVAARYGVLADHVLGVRTALQNGRLTGEVLAPVTWRKGKVDALRTRTGRRPALALGDAWTDFEMLIDAEAAIIIDRGNASLRDAIRSRGGIIQPRFEGPEVITQCPQ